MSLTVEVLRFIDRVRKEGKAHFLCPACGFTAHRGACGKDSLCETCGAISHRVGECSKPITLQEALSLFMAKSETLPTEESVLDGCSFQLKQLAFAWRREREDYIASGLLESSTVEVLDGLLR